MGTHHKWRSHFQENRTLFTILAVGLFLVELEIFALAFMHSGPKSAVQVLDQHASVVYEVKSTKLSSQDKAAFEKTFGPLANYRVQVTTKQRPFPLRAWFAAAVGLPIGAVLLFGFFIKAYEALFFGSKMDGAKVSGTPAGEPPSDRLDRLVHRVSRLNIFAIGGFVLLFALGLWALPQLLSEFGRNGVAIIVRYKWVALGIVAVLLGLVIWVIFLRYLLARKSIEAQAEVEKYRLQLELMGGQPDVRRITGAEQRRLPMPRKSRPESKSDSVDDNPM